MKLDAGGSAAGRLAAARRRRRLAGIGFTVALLIAGLAFEGEQLEEAKPGVLRRGVLGDRRVGRCSASSSGSPGLRARQLAGTAER